MKPTILCKNQYTIRKVDAEGNEREVAHFHNVPLQVFYNAVIGANVGYSVDSTVHSCWFGTGSREPSGSDTALEHPLWTYGWNYSNVTSWEKYLNEQRHVCHKYTFKIAADADHVGTVSEVGIAFMTSRGGGVALGTRALILDAEGNPMTITKTDLEALFVDVIFEFTLQDTDEFKWIPENYIGYGARSGTSWAPIFNLGLCDRIFFLGRITEDGFKQQLATLEFSKAYKNSNHELDVTNARLQQTVIPSQRYIKAIGIGSNSYSGVILGYWKLPNPDVIPPKVLRGMQVGIGDGSQTVFNAPLAEWMKDTEEIFINDVQQVRGVDYVCDHDANSLGLCECSILHEMEYAGEWTTAPQSVITPIIGNAPYRNGSYRTALWNKDHPTITYAFPEEGIKTIKRFVLRNFIAYISISSGSASYNTNWSNAIWTIEYSEDGTEWQTAGNAVIDSNNRAELILDQAVTARYWRFTISNRINGILFSAQGHDSIMAYGEQLPITFTQAPPVDAVITMNATVDCPMKNSNFIIDVNPTFEI